MTVRAFKVRVRRFSRLAEEGHEFAYCREVSGVEHGLARRLWRAYIQYTNEGRFYD